jgi:hypothetical protein
MLLNEAQAAKALKTGNVPASETTLLIKLPQPLMDVQHI